jgi:23S rRNA (uridine2552-2'-O)-methyltransferase
VEAALGGVPVDLVISDMSPNLSGIAATDQARSVALAECAVAFAVARLSPSGALLLKVFQGAGFPELLAHIRRSFEQVAIRKPEASRSRSAETYILARRPRATRAVA